MVISEHSCEGNEGVIHTPRCRGRSKLGVLSWQRKSKQLSMAGVERQGWRDRRWEEKGSWGRGRGHMIWNRALETTVRTLALSLSEKGHYPEFSAEG